MELSPDIRDRFGSVKDHRNTSIDQAETAWLY
jgi:hypothetical protein